MARLRGSFGITVSRDDALRDLVRRIGDFQDIIRDQIGGGRFNAFNEQQQAALTSVAYNYGSLPRSLVQAIQTGTAEQIAEAIRSLGSHNDGINRGRRNEEADLFVSQGDTLRTQRELVKLEEDRVKKANEYNEAFNQRISDAEFELAISGQTKREQEIQRALREENNKAIAAGTTLTETQRQQIIQTTGALYDQQNQREALNAAEEKVNQLYQLRQQLLEQQKMAQDTGDLEQVQNLRDRLSEVNAQLQQVVPAAIALWQAIGGADADAAIAKLQTTQMSIAQVGNRTTFFGLTTTQVGQLVGNFANGLTGAFTRFGEAITEGTNGFKAMGTAFLEFAANFLREIAVMIARMAILTALKNAFAGSTGFLGVIGNAAAGLLGVGTGHTAS